MKNISIDNGQFNASEIALGCMRIWKKSVSEAELLINTALENGVNLFDHADIYGKGVSEEVFSKAYTGRREDILIQTKCGIRKGFYDFSKDHILKSAEDSLRRLNTDYIDILLLHRPDTLMEPEEVAEAFDLLHKSGKVRAFGVSNHNPMQIELLNKYLAKRIIINQLQLSITNTGMIDFGLNVNMAVDKAINRDGSVLEFCRLNEITIQAWSPFQHGFIEGAFLNNDKFAALNNKIDEIAAKYNVSNTAVAAAWILRHPAKIQTIIGTTNSERLREICKASQVLLTREEWYQIYLAAGNKLP